jgi:magnesium transporter
MARTRFYLNGNLEDENFPLSDISERLDTEGGVVWVDMCAPEPAELQTVAAELALHALAVEDALSERQRPKLDHYATHDFLSAYAVEFDTTGGKLATNEIAVFIRDRALVTVRKDESFAIDEVVSRWDDSPDLMKFGVGALLHGLLDFVIDSHFSAVQSLDEQIEDLEDLLFDARAGNADVQRRSYALRKSLVLLRRVVLPMREVINTLMRRDTHALSGDLLPYYQDVYDHVLRATEWTESLRDMITSVLETNLTLQGNRLNVITKQVTSWAAIIAVPTAITGFYGQNVPYPGFSQHSGFWTSSVLIIVLSALLYAVFRRKDWL